MNLLKITKRDKMVKGDSNSRHCLYRRGSMTHPLVQYMSHNPLASNRKAYSVVGISTRNTALDGKKCL